MTRTARAAVYDAPNTPFIIKEYPVRPVRAGEVLVRITMSTICRSDIHSYLGHRPNPCPGILGHEIIGRIEEIGDGVGPDLRGDELAIGDRITWTEYFFDGPCYYREVHDMPQKCAGVQKYGHELAETDPHFLGGFADVCYVVPGSGILKLPDEITDKEATPINCGVATMASVTEAGEIGLGDTVVVQGLGLLGLYGCAMAKARGARLVIGLDSVGSRLAQGREFGADVTLDVAAMTPAELVKQVRRLCPPDGVDVAIEVCGVPDVIPTGLDMLRVGGRYVLAGIVSPGADVTLDANVFVKRWITLRGIHNYHPRHLVQALDFVMSNRDRFPFETLVDGVFPLEKIGEAFDKAASREILRGAIVP
ncbi:MAG: zinc-binding dehydrogenase [Rhodospirillaceae bacterium]